MKGPEWEGIAKIADVFFNGRRAAEARDREAESRPSISMADLVTRKVSHVRCQGKLYKVTVEEVEITK